MEQLYCFLPIISISVGKVISGATLAMVLLLVVLHFAIPSSRRPRMWLSGKKPEGFDPKTCKFLRVHQIPFPRKDLDFYGEMLKLEIGQSLWIEMPQNESSQLLIFRLASDRIAYPDGSGSIDLSPYICLQTAHVDINRFTVSRGENLWVIDYYTTDKLIHFILTRDTGSWTKYLK